MLSIPNGQEIGRVLEWGILRKGFSLIAVFIKDTPVLPEVLADRKRFGMPRVAGIASCLLT